MVYFLCKNANVFTPVRHPVPSMRRVGEYMNKHLLQSLDLDQTDLFASQ